LSACAATACAAAARRVKVRVLGISGISVRQLLSTAASFCWEDFQSLPTAYFVSLKDYANNRWLMACRYCWDEHCLSSIPVRKEC
jgi:hypothetical protein